MSPFDKVRYERLLEGLEATEVALSRVGHDNEVLRIDAEYFGKNVLAAVQRLMSIKARALEEQAFITDGIHTSLPFVDDGEVRVLSAKHPKDNYIAAGPFECVTAKFHAQNPRTALRENDVLISTVGTIGNSAVVTDDILPANSDRHIGIIRVRDDGPAPFFLSTFLVCRYGRIQSVRETTGNVQPNLFISKIGRLLIPRFTPAFEQGIATRVENAYASRKQAANVLAQAGQSLLQSLGLDAWMPPEALTYERSSREAFAARRLDAEFFSPKTNAIRAILRTRGDLALGSICKVSTGFPWKSDSFIERGGNDGCPFVRIRDCKPGALKGDDLDRLPDSEIVAAQQLPAEAGDLMVGMDGLKWFYAGMLLDPCYVNQRVGWLHSFRADFPSAFVMAVINSIIGQSQLLSQMTIAQTVGHITLDDLRGLRIPILDSATRTAIAASVQQSIRAGQRANEILDAAKRAVEIAVEDSEVAALSYLKAALV